MKKMFMYRFILWNENKKMARNLAELFLDDGMFARLETSPCGTISVSVISEKEFTDIDIKSYEKVYQVCLVDSKKVKA